MSLCCQSVFLSVYGLSPTKKYHFLVPFTFFCYYLIQIAFFANNGPLTADEAIQFLNSMTEGIHCWPQSIMDIKDLTKKIQQKAIFIVNAQDLLIDGVLYCKCKIKLPGTSFITLQLKLVSSQSNRQKTNFFQVIIGPFRRRSTYFFKDYS